MTASNPQAGQRLRDVLQNDVQTRAWKIDFPREFRELEEFYIDEKTREGLKSRGKLSRLIRTIFLILRSMFMKLTPIRRLFVIVAVILILTSPSVGFDSSQVHFQTNTSIAGALLLLFVLLLELKDKLLAHDELKAGKAVQAALMPDPCLILPGWSICLHTQTANDVGGDLIDVQRLSDGRLRITLADVAGKGLSAALVSTRLQATVRAFSTESITLPELIRQVNRIFFRDKIKTSFASLFCVEITPGSPDLLFVNAGHFPPLAVRGTGVSELPKGDPAIGLAPDSVYSEIRYTVEPGDLLFVYTDGLTDAKNSAGTFFGLDHVRQILPSISGFDAARIGSRILEILSLHVGDTPAYDDCSLMILKRTA